MTTFTPWAFIYVGMTVIEYFTQSMLVIRWRRWLTEHFVSRWLDCHNHYRISLVSGQTDNPDQRISEDIPSFIQNTLLIGLSILSKITSLVPIGM